MEISADDHALAARWRSEDKDNIDAGGEEEDAEHQKRWCEGKVSKAGSFPRLGEKLVEGGGKGRWVKLGRRRGERGRK